MTIRSKSNNRPHSHSWLQSLCGVMLSSQYIINQCTVLFPFNDGHTFAQNKPNLVGYIHILWYVGVISPQWYVTVCTITPVMTSDELLIVYCPHGRLSLDSPLSLPPVSYNPSVVSTAWRTWHSTPLYRPAVIGSIIRCVSNQRITMVLLYFYTNISIEWAGWIVICVELSTIDQIKVGLCEMPTNH